MGHNSRQGYFLGQELLLDFAAWIDLTCYTSLFWANDICFDGQSFDVTITCKNNQFPVSEPMCIFFKIDILIFERSKRTERKKKNLPTSYRAGVTAKQIQIWPVQRLITCTNEAVVTD